MIKKTVAICSQILVSQFYSLNSRPKFHGFLLPTSPTIHRPTAEAV